MPAAEAAARYGLERDRSGRALCPFHDDRRPSMSFRDGRWRCWSCGAAGDSIDLTARLLGLSAAEALARLDADFSLGLGSGGDRPSRHTAAAQARQRAEAARYAEWREALLRRLSLAIRAGHAALRRGGTLTAAQAHALYWLAALTDWADALAAPDMDAQMTVFRDREGIDRICKEILDHTETRSGTD